MTTTDGAPGRPMCARWADHLRPGEVYGQGPHTAATPPPGRQTCRQWDGARWIEVAIPSVTPTSAPWPLGPG